MYVPVFLALAAAALFGAATPFSKYLLGSVNPFLLAGLLYLGAGLALAPKALRGGLYGKIRTLNPKNARYVLGSIVSGGMLGPVLLLFGLRMAKSASVSLWLNLELVATAVTGHLLFQDRMTRTSAGATAGILGASILLSFEGGQASVGGGLLVGAACLAWGFDNHFTALIDGLKPTESTFLKGIAAGTTNLLVGIAVSGGLNVSLSASVLALVMGSLSYGLSIVLYISAAQGLGASRAQLFFSSSPVFGIFIAAIMLGEAISAAQVAAFLVMALSYLLLFSERHGHGHAHPAGEHTHWHRHGDGHHGHEHPALGFLGKLFGHSHGHRHEAVMHEHSHVSDIHHRHAHGSGKC